jgi:hypothetical protein
MLVDVTIHYGGIVQHNPFVDVGGYGDEVQSYNIDFLSV